MRWLKWGDKMQRCWKISLHFIIHLGGWCFSYSKKLNILSFTNFAIIVGLWGVRCTGVFVILSHSFTYLYCEFLLPVPSMGLTHFGVCLPGSPIPLFSQSGQPLLSQQSRKTVIIAGCSLALPPRPFNLLSSRMELSLIGAPQSGKSGALTQTSQEKSWHTTSVVLDDNNQNNWYHKFSFGSLHRNNLSNIIIF